MANFSTMLKDMHRKPLGIGIIDGVWDVMGADIIDGHLYSPRTAPNDPAAMERFVAILIERTKPTRFPQIVFGSSEQVDLFLELDVPALRGLQEYVRQVRLTKNTLVATAQELADLNGIKPVDIDEPWWLLNLLTAKYRVPEALHSPFRHMQMTRLFNLPMTGSKRIDDDWESFALLRHLHMSDALIRSLESPPAHSIPAKDPLTFEEACTDDAEAAAFVFVPKRKARAKIVWIAEPGDKWRGSGTAGQMVQIPFPAYKPVRNPFTPKPLEAPLDILAAA